MLSFSFPRLAALFAALTLTACSTLPPPPQIDAKKGDRIGVFVEGGDTPVHTHVGTTVFNNFTKVYPYRWNLRAQVQQSVQKGVERAGFVPVDLRAEGLAYADVAELIKVEDKAWKIAPGKDANIRRLHNQYRLKAVVVLKEGSTLVYRGVCGPGGCDEGYTNQAGLFTRSHFTLDNYFAVPGYNWNVFVLDPIADISALAASAKEYTYVSPRLDGFKPANFKELTEAELRVVQARILEMVERQTGGQLMGLTSK